MVLTEVLSIGTPLENRLAELGAKCSGVVVCRSSPSQKAAIVKIMTVSTMPCPLARLHRTLICI